MFVGKVSFEIPLMLHLSRLVMGMLMVFVMVVLVLIICWFNQELSPMIALTAPLSSVDEDIDDVDVIVYVMLMIWWFVGSPM